MSSSSFQSTDDQLSFADFLDNILVDFPSQTPIPFSSGSGNSTQKNNSSSSGSVNGETNQRVANSIDERRRNRKISNRESARRSRMRKQNHFENLRNQVTQYSTGNQELMSRLRIVNHNGQLVRRENERLRFESVMLQQRLYNLRQLLVTPELNHALVQSAMPCNNNVTNINEHNLLSLITF